MKKMLLSTVLGIAVLSVLTSTASAAYYYGYNNNYYPYNNYNQNVTYTVKQISPCLSYKYNYYGQFIESVNTCNNYSDYYYSDYNYVDYSGYNTSYPTYKCVVSQVYPYTNVCGYNYSNTGHSHHSHDYYNYYNNYNNYNNNCSYYYYDMYGNYVCTSYNNTYPVLFNY